MTAAKDHMHKGQFLPENDLPDLHRLGPTFSMPLMPFSTMVAYCILLGICIYYLSQYLEFSPLVPLVKFLWSCLVYLTPESLVVLLHQAATMIKQHSKNRARRSEALQKLLGLDGEGIMAKIQRTANLPLFGVMGMPSHRGPPGLLNVDYSCYQNSIIQALASLKSLPGYLNQGVPDEDSFPAKVALGRLISRLNSPSNAGRLLYTDPALKNMSSSQQQDAQEYYSKILDEVDKELPKDSGLLALLETESESDGVPKNSYVRRAGLYGLPNELQALVARNPLEGLLAQRVGCQTCSYVEGLSLIPFNCLTVPLGRRSAYHIRSCLDDYTNLERINGVECAQCTLLQRQQYLETKIRELESEHQFEKVLAELKHTEYKAVPNTPSGLKEFLKDKRITVDNTLINQDFSDTSLKRCEISAADKISTTKSKQEVIARAPKSLVIHVNRSVLDEISGVQRKNFAVVKFPMVLDLSSWCLGSDLMSDYGGTEMQNWNVDPAVSMLSSEARGMPMDPRNLHGLRAVISHKGGHESGHYICYRRYPTESLEDGEDAKPAAAWWRLSDDQVSEVREENLGTEGEVFMLFYEMEEHAQLPEKFNHGRFEAQSDAQIGPLGDLLELDGHGPLLAPIEKHTIEPEEQNELAARTQSTMARSDDQDNSRALEEQTVALLEKSLELPSSAPSSQAEPLSTIAADTSVTRTPRRQDQLATETSSDTSSESSTESEILEPDPFPLPTEGTTTSGHHTASEASIETQSPESDPSPIPEGALKESRKVTPMMRTAPPKGNRGSVRGASGAMDQVSMVISAN